MALNILIVDDSAVVRAMIAKTLRLAGVPLGEVHQAATVWKVWRCLNRTGWTWSSPTSTCR
jgi:hypothetical protein